MGTIKLHRTKGKLHYSTKLWLISYTLTYRHHCAWSELTNRRNDQLTLRATVPTTAEMRKNIRPNVSGLKQRLNIGKMLIYSVEPKHPKLAVISRWVIMYDSLWVMFITVGLSDVNSQWSRYWFCSQRVSRPTRISNVDWFNNKPSRRLDVVWFNIGPVYSLAQGRTVFWKRKLRRNVGRRILERCLL